MAPQGVGDWENPGLAGMGRTSLAEVRGIAVLGSGRLWRECLRLALAHRAPTAHLAEAPTVQELLDLVADGAEFDLVLAGLVTISERDLEQIGRLRHALPGTPIAVVAESEDREWARRLLATGVRGFLPASLSLKVALGALDLVLAGGIFVPASLIDAAGSQGQAQGAAHPCSQLTSRQRDILALVAQGKPNKLIAAALAIPEGAVKAHVKQIIRRLRVANRTQAALVAAQRMAQSGAETATVLLESRAAPASREIVLLAEAMNRLCLRLEAVESRSRGGWRPRLCTIRPVGRRDPQAIPPQEAS